MLEAGVMPDVISSDIHQMAIQGPMFDLPTTLSKFLNLGLSLPDVIERATSRPAAAMRRPDLGTLKPGSAADVAIFRLEEGDYVFRDVHMSPRRGDKRLINTLTMIDGEVLPQSAGDARLQPWAGDSRSGSRASLPPEQGSNRRPEDGTTTTGQLPQELIERLKPGSGCSRWTSCPACAIVTRLVAGRTCQHSVNPIRVDAAGLPQDQQRRLRQ